MPDSQLVCHLSMVQNQSIVKFAIRRLIIFNKYRRERYPLLHSLSLIREWRKLLEKLWNLGCHRPSHQVLLKFFQFHSVCQKLCNFICLWVSTFHSHLHPRPTFKDEICPADRLVLQGLLPLTLECPRSMRLPGERNFPYYSNTVSVGESTGPVFSQLLNVLDFKQHLFLLCTFQQQGGKL